MSITNAASKMRDAMDRLEGVQALPHRFGGTEYRLGRRELGHMHGNEMVDVPFPRRVRGEVITQGPAEEPHLLPRAGWVSCYLRRPEDADRAMALLERAYALALDQRSRRRTEIEPDEPQA